MLEIFDNIILAQIPDTQYSCITFFLCAGAINEGEDNKGIAHLLEHTLTAQTEMGINFEAETQSEYALFQSVQLPQDTNSNLERLKELLFEAQLNKEDFLIQKQRLKFELRTSYQHHMFQDVYGEIFGKDSAQYQGWSGTEESVDALTLHDIKKYRKRFFTEDNIIIVISGNFDKESAQKMISKLSLKKKSVTQTSTVNSLESKIVWKTHRGEDVSGTDVFIPASTLSNYKERASDEVFQNTLLNGSNTLLENLLYKDLGTVYSTETELLHWSNGGVFAFGYQTLNENIEETNDVVESLLKDLPNRLSREKIDTARNKSLIMFNENLRNPERLGRWVGENALLTDNVITLTKYEEYLKSTTHKDVLQKADTVSKMPFIKL